MDKHVVDPFTSAGLRRIVPVEQQKIVNGFSITTYSLELYVNGFAIVAHTEWTDGRTPGGVVTFRCEDDLGGTYRSRDYAGSGGGVPGKNRHYQRYYYLCTPGINPTAKTLHLEAPHVKVYDTHYDPDRPSPPTTELIEQIEGPWVFDVSLAK